MAAVVGSVANAVASALSGRTNASDNVLPNGAEENANNAAQASAGEGTRLYIGNLAYATTEEQLREAFSGFLVVSRHAFAFSNAGWRLDEYTHLADTICALPQESVTIPKNPRTDRPVGYAFVEVSTPKEVEQAIAKLSGREILERKVSVQLARAPTTPAEKAERNGDNAEGSRHRPSARGGRGRGRGGIGNGRGGRLGASVSNQRGMCKSTMA